MRAACVALCGLICGLGTGAAWAQGSEWEGAVGLTARRSPNYLGSATSAWHLTPGLFLRYGRFSITTTGGFVTRRNDEVERGATAELLDANDLRVTISARTDGGRDAGTDPALNGLPDVKPTIRLRLGAVQKLPDGWRLSGGVSPDILGRHGGITADFGLGREWRLSPTLVWGLGVGGTWADAQYMQSYFGITPERSSASGHPAYRPSSGLRDVGWGATLRYDFHPRWIAIAGIGATRLEGPAAKSPLSTGRTSANVSAGLAWRF